VTDNKGKENGMKYFKSTGEVPAILKHIIME
jgi:hypothetical protein